jgi:uncharacterized protein (TIGR03663 family)
MAQITLPTTERASWLDRPLLPTWQRVAAVSVNWEMVAYATLILLGFALRIWDVGGRAMHHDESLHAYYSWLFYTGKGYTYDPLMHGPFQFEVVPIFYLLFGAGEFAARMLAVVLGTVLIGLPYLLRRYLMVPGALLASLMLAISPAFVYYSRFIRDDIYLACFSLLMFVSIVRYIESRRSVWLYILAAATALAVASMEAAYLTIFIFGSFLIFQALRERLGTGGPLLAALRATSLDTWLMAAAIFVVLTVLFYSTFFTNPYGIWDTRYPLFTHTGHGLAIDPNRKDILGGIGYWQAQHYVERGGQPWFYYLLLMPLYEQLALLFGIAGIVYCALRRTLVGTFLVWWAVMAFALYSWAGEKMPWLVIHIVLPLILLAGYFLGNMALSRWRRAFLASGIAFLALLALELHSTFMLNYVDGANPTEMLIYVQTSQDVPTVANEIKRMPEWPNVTVGLDTQDVGGWPFEWYLRDDTAVTQTTTFNGPQCGGQYCQVLLMLGPEYDQYSSTLLSHYVAQKYRWNWWFPEDYKVWFPTNFGAFFSGHGSLSDLVGTPTDWSHIWNWLIYRTPFGPRDARWMYVLVRRDLVPGAKYYPKRGANPSSVTAVSAPALHYALQSSLSGTSSPLYGPRGIAADSKGNVYVADTLNHRVVEFGRSGREVRTFGSAGTAPGQFSTNNSPLGVAVGPDGLIYVTDTWNQRIEVFSPAGKLVREWGGGAIGSGPGQFYGPRSLAVAPSGRVYVADTGNKRIQVFTSRGKYLFSWGASGSGSGQFNEPSSVALDASGRVYVSDFWNQRIQVFTPSGHFLRSWSVPDWMPQSYDEPYLAVDRSTGHILASDPGQQQVLVYTDTGKVVGAIGSGNLPMPIGVAVTDNGHVLASEPNANRIAVLVKNTGSTTPRQSYGKVTKAGSGSQPQSSH